jgi:hypothetical protein
MNKQERIVNNVKHLTSFVPAALGLLKLVAEEERQGSLYIP